jgi:deoxyribonuclease-4
VAKAMALLGAHLPTRGNLASALELGAQLGCQVVQLFVKSPMQWMAPPLTEAAVSAFLDARSRTKPQILVAHAAYLINLASPKREVLQLSRQALLEEARRCQRLGIAFLVVHAGAHLGSGERSGLQRLRDSLHWLLDHLDNSSTPVTLLLENTAGQGSCLGARLGQLATAIGDLPCELVGVCLDTCHLFAAGYELRTEEGVAALAKEIAETVEWQRVRLLHANDSLRPFGSRVDRHWHIGEGHIGMNGFRALLRHPHFSSLPIVLETPQAERKHAENLRRLRSLFATPQS